MAARSGLQRSVLSLYRQCLRAVRSKPASKQDSFRRYIRQQFRQNATKVDRRDFSAVEYLLRRGERQLEQYSSPTITNIAA